MKHDHDNSPSLRHTQSAWFITTLALADVIVHSAIFHLLMSAVASKLASKFMSNPRIARNTNIVAACVCVGIGISALFV